MSKKLEDNMERLVNMHYKMQISKLVINISTKDA